MYLNFELISDKMYDPASRALSCIISKLIKNKGLPLKVYKILFESCVLSVCLYGSETWGFKPKKSLDKLFNRAIRTFLGLGSTAPMAGVKSELLWLQPTSQAHIRIINLFSRLRDLPQNRLTRKVFDWDSHLSTLYPNMKTWPSEVKDILRRNNFYIYFDVPLNKKDLSK